jgi:hypothetical protein
MAKGGEVQEVGNEFVMSTKSFENLVTISVVFNIVPEFVSSESDRLLGVLGHCQSVWSGSKS